VIAAADPAAGVPGITSTVVRDVRVLAIPPPGTVAGPGGADGGGLLIIAAAPRQAAALAAAATTSRLSVDVRPPE
jgi:hypothetical protein